MQITKMLFFYLECLCSGYRGRFFFFSINKWKL